MHLARNESGSAIWGIEIALIAEHPPAVKNLGCFVRVGLLQRNAEPEIGIEVGQFVHDGIANMFVRQRFRRVFI